MACRQDKTDIKSRPLQGIVTQKLFRIVDKIAGEILVVGCHVDKSVSGKVEQNHLALAGFLALVCLVYGR